MKAFGRKIRDMVMKEKQFSKMDLDIMVPSSITILKGKAVMNGLLAIFMKECGDNLKWKDKENSRMQMAESIKAFLKRTITYKISASLILWMMKKSKRGIKEFLKKLFCNKKKR